MCAYIALHLITGRLFKRSMLLCVSGRKNNGTAPSHFRKSCSSIARRVLQSLESVKMVEKDDNGGRRLTAAGRRDLDRIAAQLYSKNKAARKSAAAAGVIDA